MRGAGGRRFLLAALALSWALADVSQAAGPAYSLIKEIPIGGTGGWDYISIDPQARRLYVAHATRIDVVDADTGRSIGEIPDTPGVHGFAIAADLGRGFSSNGRSDTATIVDLKTLTAVGTIPTGGNPDAIVYDPARKEVYTFNGSGRSATVIDARAGHVLATIPLGGKPEAAVVDPSAHRVFVNIEDASTIAAIDTASHAVVGTWPLRRCEGPTGLAYDAAHHRLFSACRNKLITITDSITGRAIATFDIGAGVDGAVFDAQTGFVFSSNGEGTVTIATVGADGKPAIVQTLKTQPSARTIALDPATHNIYLPAARTTARYKAGGGRRAEPGTFTVLVYGPSPPPKS